MPRPHNVQRDYPTQKIEGEICIVSVKSFFTELTSVEF